MRSDFLPPFRSFAILTFGLCLCGLPFAPSWAAGVLLPSTGQNSNANQPNIGIAPAPKPAPAPTANQPKPPAATGAEQKICENPAQGCGPGSPLPQKPSPESIKDFSMPPINITPGGKTTADGEDLAKQITGSAKVRDITSGLDKNTAAWLTKMKADIDKKQSEKRAKYSSPPIFSDEADIPKEYETGGKTMPYSVNVAVFQEYRWGRMDVMAIKNLLGYAKEQIPANCQLRITFSVATDEAVSGGRGGSYTAKVFSGQRAAIDYSGRLKSIDLMPMAICNKPAGELPQRGGLIWKIGNKYGVQLVSFPKCPLPQSSVSPRSLEVQYLGDEAAKCQYK